jgi:proteic killer suppression protein
LAASRKALGIDRLGNEERLTLVEEIWDSIAVDSAAVPLPPDQAQEHERFFLSGVKSGIRPDHADRLRLVLGRLAAATAPKDMALPGLRLHPLKGKLKGRWSVTISGNWRLTSVRQVKRDHSVPALRACPCVGTGTHAELNVIAAETEWENPASVRVLEKVGFVGAGTASDPSGTRFELRARIE